MQEKGNRRGSAVVVRHGEPHHVVAGPVVGVRADNDAGREHARRALRDGDRSCGQSRVVAPVDRCSERLAVPAVLLVKPGR